MNCSQNGTAQKLMKSFLQFNRLHWQQSPIAGLKPSEIFVLYNIKQKAVSDTPGIKVSELSKILKVTSPTVTQLIKGLESNGYVERSIDPDDRRAVRIRLTDKGESTVIKASETFFASFIGLVEYLGEEKSNELAELLSNVFIYFHELRKSSFNSFNLE